MDELEGHHASEDAGERRPRGRDREPTRTGLRTLFLGSDLDFHCEKAVDADDSGELALPDVVYVLNYLFLGQAAPPAPFPDVGEDATPDDLGCVRYP